MKDEKVIEKLNAVKEAERINIERYNQELEEAEQRVKSGQYVAQQEAKSRASQW